MIVPPPSPWTTKAVFVAFAVQFLLSLGALLYVVGRVYLFPTVVPFDIVSSRNMTGCPGGGINLETRLPQSGSAGLYWHTETWWQDGRIVWESNSHLVLIPPNVSYVVIPQRVPPNLLPGTYQLWVAWERREEGHGPSASLINMTVEPCP